MCSQTTGAGRFDYPHVGAPIALSRVDGRPGPKGSLNSWCLRCARSKLKQVIVTKEESDTGVVFRQLVARRIKANRRGLQAFDGPVEVILTFYLKRQRKVAKGIETDDWVPSHRTPVPVHHGSGDIEKHIRTINDALKGVFTDDQLVWRTEACKLWADESHPPGVEIEVLGWALPNESEEGHS